MSMQAIYNRKLSVEGLIKSWDKPAALTSNEHLGVWVCSYNRELHVFGVECLIKLVALVRQMAAWMSQAMCSSRDAHTKLSSCFDQF